MNIKKNIMHVVFSQHSYKLLIAKYKYTNEVPEYILQCYETTVSNSDDTSTLIKIINIYNEISYQPQNYSDKINKLINNLFNDSSLNNNRLSEALNIDGVPLLKVKDNDLLVYTYNRYYYILSASLELVKKYNIEEVGISGSPSSKVIIPEWPNYEYLLNPDAVLSPIFNKLLSIAGYKVKHLNLINTGYCQLKIKVRSLLLSGYRVVTIIKRAIKWRTYNIASNSKNSLAIWVRSAGQVRELEVCVKEWKGKINVFYIQDDSLRKNDCYTYLRNHKDTLQFVNSHYYLTISDFINALIIWQKFIWYDYRKIKYYCNTNYDDPLIECLDSVSVRKAVIKSISEAIFLGYITTKELKKSHEHIQYQAMLILNCFDQWGNISGYLAKELRFKTASIQNFSSVPYRLPNPYDNYDYVITYDQMEKIQLINSGCDSSKIHALGGILFDILRNNKLQKIIREKTRKKFMFETDNKLVLCATQSFKDKLCEENIILCQTIISYISMNENVEGIIKIHPYEELSQYAEIIREIEHKKLSITIIKNHPIEEIISACDIFFTRYSATITSAILLKKPVVSLLAAHEYQSSLDFISFLKKGYVKVTQSKEEAVDVLNEMMDNKVRNEWTDKIENRLSKEYKTYDGKSKERIMDFIESKLLV